MAGFVNDAANEVGRSTASPNNRKRNRSADDEANLHEQPPFQKVRSKSPIYTHSSTCRKRNSRNELVNEGEDVDFGGMGVAAGFQLVQPPAQKKQRPRAVPVPVPGSDSDDHDMPFASDDDDDDDDDDGDEEQDDWEGGEDEGDQLGDRVEEVEEDLEDQREHKRQLLARAAAWSNDDWKDFADHLLASPVSVKSTKKEVLLALESFHLLFCSPYQNGQRDVLDRVGSLFPNASVMDKRYLEIQNVFGALHIELITRGIADEHTRKGRAFSAKLTQVAMGLKTSYNLMVQTKLLLHSNDRSLCDYLGTLCPTTMFRQVALDKLKPSQQLLHFYYHKASSHRYRRQNGAIYKPRYTEDGTFTESYEYEMEISDFVYSSLMPVSLHEYWFNALTSSGNVARECIETLTKVKCEWLPDLDPNPHIFGFQNGLFKTDDNKFYYFQPPEGKWGVDQIVGKKTACKFHDMVYDEMGMAAEMSKPGATFVHILMPNTYKILLSQQFEKMEVVWILGLLGRLLHPLNVKDNWGCMPFFLGLAGTGKSSLLRLLACLFDKNDVGYFANVGQKKFFFDGYCDKRVFLALDIDNHFSMDQTTFQSVAVGEEVAVIRKYKVPRTVKWDIPGAFAGNKLPAWKDNSGSLFRRLIVLEFQYTVRRCDPNLFKKCMAERDRFLTVINSAYFYLCALYSDKAIAEVLPQKFLDSGKKALLQLDPLTAFMEEYCEVEDDEKKTFVQPLSEFRKAYLLYTRRNQIRDHPFTYNTYSGVFAKRQIVVKSRPGPDDPRSSKPYILGLKLAPGAFAALEQDA